MDKGAFESFSQVEYITILKMLVMKKNQLPVTIEKPPNGSFYFQGTRVRFTDINPTPQALEEFQDMFQELGFALTPKETAEWLDNDANDTGVQLRYTDSEICDLVMNTNNDDSDDEMDEESEKKAYAPVSNNQAAHYSQQCLTWLEHQPEATAYNTTVLRELQSLASNKRVQSLKQASDKLLLNNAIKLIFTIVCA